MKKLNKKALRYAIWSSMSRVISAALGAGAGIMVHQLLGDNALSWSVAFIFALISVVFMFIAEYKKELDEE